MSTFDDEIAENKSKIEATLASKEYNSTQQYRAAGQYNKKPAMGIRFKILEKRVKELDLEVQSLRDQIRRLEKFVSME